MPAALFVLILIVAHVRARRRYRPLAPGTRADRVLVEKSRRRLTLFQAGVPLKSYRIALGFGGAAPKRREGDGLTPEGLYHVCGRNPASRFHLSLRLSYPDNADRARAARAGVPPGGDIMIHGLRNGFGWLGPFHHLYDWTAGCVAVTDREMDELWRAIPDGTPVDIRRG